MTNSILRLAAAVPALVTAETLMSRPVAKVVALLQQMLDEKHAEQEEDEKIKSKLECWSKKSKETSEAIVAESKGKNAEAQALLEASSACKEEAETNRGILAKRKNDFSLALTQAHAVEEDRSTRFNNENVDELGDLKALEAAIREVEKSHPDSLVQKKESELFARRLVKSIMFRHGSSELATSSTITAFLSDEGDDLSPSGIDLDSLNAAGVNSYDAESGSILGTLKTIHETLEGDMGDAYADHKAAKLAYEKFVTEKNAQLAQIEDDILKKEARKAECSQNEIKAKKTLGSSGEKFETAKAFLQELAQSSQQTKAEHAERTQMRSDEITALTKAIEMLASDESRALFDKTTKKSDVSFLQLARTSFNSRRNQAARTLAQLSAKTHSKTLSAVAAAMRVSFSGKDELLKKIDENVNVLQQQKADEVQEKDNCVGNFQRIEKSTLDANQAKTGFEAEIALDEKKIEKSNADIEQLQGENDALKTAMLEASEDREEENNAFQTSTKDNREAARILSKVKGELAKVYEKKEAALIQSKDVERPDGVGARPDDFAAYTQHSGAGGVLMLLDKIISDTTALLKESMAAEIEAQATYEKFTLSAQSDIKNNLAMILTTSQEKTKLQGGKQELTKSLGDKNDDLKNFAQEETEAHAACDFLMEHFDLRQDKIQDEIDGLTEAVQILSGAVFDA